MKEFDMKPFERRIFRLSLLAAAVFALAVSAGAMHIMEGYLPLTHSIAWGAVCLPFVVLGVVKIKKLYPRTAKPCCCWPWPAPTASCCPR